MKKIKIPFRSEQFLLDAVLAAGFILAVYVFRAMMQRSGGMNPLLYILLSICSLTMAGHYCAGLYVSYSSGGLAGATLPPEGDSDDRIKNASGYTHVIRAIILKSVCFIYLISLFMIQPSLLYGFMVEMARGTRSQDMETLAMMFAFIAPFAFVSMGFIAGIYGRESHKTIRTLFRFLALFFLVPLFLISLPSIQFRIRDLTSGVFHLTAHQMVVVSIISAVLPLLIAVLLVPYAIQKASETLDRSASSERSTCRKMWTFVIYPVLITIILYVWNEAIIHAVTAKERNQQAIADLLLVILFGPFPLRFLRALVPPVRPINLVISIAVLTILMYRTYAYISSAKGTF